MITGEAAKEGFEMSETIWSDEDKFAAGCLHLLLPLAVFLKGEWCFSFCFFILPQRGTYGGIFNCGSKETEVKTLIATFISSTPSSLVIFPPLIHPQ